MTVKTEPGTDIGGASSSRHPNPQPLMSYSNPNPYTHPYNLQYPFAPRLFTWRAHQPQNNPNAGVPPSAYLYYPGRNTAAGMHIITIINHLMAGK